jgi:hypothetical protein
VRSRSGRARSRRRASRAASSQRLFHRRAASQRLEQQQLELDQRQRQRGLERSVGLTDDAAARRSLELQRGLFRQERELQIMRFQTDQHRLEQSLDRRPLQPQPIPGTLRLP